MAGLKNINNMKAKMLKIAGVKSEKEFYKKYPTEEAFMKVHGKAFKKAQIGAYIGGERSAVPETINFSDIYNMNDKAMTGSTQDERDYQDYLNSQAAAPADSSGGGGIANMLGGSGESGGTGFDLSKMFGDKSALQDVDVSSIVGKGKRGAKVKKLQGGDNVEPMLQDFPDYGSWQSAHSAWEAAGGASQNAAGQTVGTKIGGNQLAKTTASNSKTGAANAAAANKGKDAMAGLQKILGPAGKIVGAFQNLAAEKEIRREAEQAKQVSDLALKASRVKPDITERRYVRAENIRNTGEEFFPIYGVGSPGNPYGSTVLSRYGSKIPRAQYGEMIDSEDNVDYEDIGGNPTEIQNTYAPNNLYDDLGYEPLDDSDQAKQYYYGGGLRRAQSGISQFASAGGTEMVGNVIKGIGGENAGGDIGGQIGGTIGSIWGPVGNLIGSTFGRGVGAILDRNPKRTKQANIAQNRNTNAISATQGIQGVQSQYSSFVKEGGLIPKAQDGKGPKDLTVKDGKCAREEAVKKADKKQGKIDARENAANDAAVAKEQKEADRQREREFAEYADERLTGYGDKIKQKEFDAAYSAFAAQNPELAKDRLLYTLANKEINKIRNNPDYRMRSILGRVNPNLDYKTLTLPQLMQTMQQGYGSGQGYYDAWKSGFPVRSAIQSQQDGGQTSPYEWNSHTWQPQVITQFGEHKLKDLLAPPKDADMLRAGGAIRDIRHNYRTADEAALTQMSLGGQIETTWGGYAEPISSNKFMPASGQTIMFKGNTHEQSDGKGNTGIGVKYGKVRDGYMDYAEYGTQADADVEVETNEPATEIPDATGQNNMVVYGNLGINSIAAAMIGDPKAQGKKYKHYIKDLSKQENKWNSKIQKAAEELDQLNPVTSMDKLRLGTLQANILGGNSHLKDIAKFKKNAAFVQNATNDTAEEMGIVADDLAKGRIKFDKEAFKNTAKFGTSIPTAQAGTSMPDESISDADLARLTDLYEKAKTQKRGDAVLDFQKEFHRLLPKTALQYNKNTKFLTKTARSLGLKKSDFDKIDPNNPTGDLEQRFLLGNQDKYFGPITTSYLKMAQNRVKAKDIPELTTIPPYVPQATTTVTETTTLYPITPYKRSGLLDFFGQALPYLRKADTEALDLNQVAGEMYALGNNQLEPVQAQQISYDLGVPYDISLQDMINETRASTRAAQRTMGYSPAAQANLAAQEYTQINKILGEQFRMNQAEKARVYEKNRDLVNQMKLQNLAILDKQYERQAKAKSATKAVAQAALNSISSKVAQNKLENRKLETLENLFNFRYDNKFRTVNMNAPWQPTIPTVYTGPTAQAGIPGAIAAVGQTPSKASVQGVNNLPATNVAPPTIPPLATPPYVPYTGQEEMFTPESLKEQLLYPEQQKYGGSVKKKSNEVKRNSSIVRALKNI